MNTLLRPISQAARLAGVALLALLALTGCVDSEAPLSPRVNSSSGSAGAWILDAAHGGDEGFNFLPPITADPGMKNEFYDFLEPVVRVCRLVGDVCGGTVAEFSRSTGPGSETIRIDEVADLFIVQLHTGPLNLELSRHRIEVLLGDASLGHADFELVGTAGEAQQLRSSGGFPVVQGSTLPIKFRITGDPFWIVDPPTAALISTEAELAAGTYRFQLAGPAPPEVDVGTVIVGTESGGFIREVISYTSTGSELVLGTQQASLSRIAATGSFQTSVSINASTGSGQPQLRHNEAPAPDHLIWGETRAAFLAEGVSAIAGGLSLQDLDLCNDLIQGLCPNGVTLGVANGDVTFDPTLDLGGSFSFFALDEFHAIATGDLTFSADLSLGASISFSTSGEKALAEFVRPFLIPPTVLFPFPIAGVATVSFVAGYEADAQAAVTAQVGLSSQTTAMLGGRYEQGVWSPVHTLSTTNSGPSASWDAGAGAKARLYVRPEVTVLLYGVVGPFLSADPFLLAEGQLSQSICELRLTLGVDAHVGVQVGMLDAAVQPLSADLTGPTAVLKSLDCSERESLDVDVGSRISPDAIAFRFGAPGFLPSVPVTLTLVDTEGRPLVVDPSEILWTASDPDVAVVQPIGFRTHNPGEYMNLISSFVSNGTAVVTATYRGLEFEVQVSSTGRLGAPPPPPPTGPQPGDDYDMDGVAYGDDLCRGSTPGASVDGDGCEILNDVVVRTYAVSGGSCDDAVPRCDLLGGGRARVTWVGLDSQGELADRLDDVAVSWTVTGTGFLFSDGTIGGVESGTGTLELRVEHPNVSKVVDVEVNVDGGLTDLVAGGELSVDGQPAVAAALQGVTRLIDGQFWTILTLTAEDAVFPDGGQQVYCVGGARTAGTIECRRPYHTNLGTVLSYDRATWDGSEFAAPVFDGVSLVFTKTRTCDPDDSILSCIQGS